MSTEPDITPTFNSVYRHGVDEKRRLAIPSKWRPKNPEFEFTLVLFPSQAVPNRQFLLALPPDVLNGLKKKFQERSYSDPEAESLRRYLGFNSEQVVLDKAGRIVLPTDLAAGAGISDKAVLVGTFDRFEIWSPEGFEEARKVDVVLAPKALKLI